VAHPNFSMPSNGSANPDLDEGGSQRVCIDCKCPATKYRRDRCNKCYKRLRAVEDRAARGLPPRRATEEDPAKKLLRKIAAGQDGCWIYTGSTSDQGYGVFYFPGARWALAHRAAYTIFVGPIPDGLHLDHTCHNKSDCPGGTACRHRRCVNPGHLEAVTPVENIRRSRHTLASKFGGRSHCAAGHEYTDENTRWYVRTKETRPVRKCRTCEARYRCAKRRRERGES
jgi:hypothetical protein